MNDEREKTGDEEASGEPQGAIGGERLAEARRAQQISVLEVAKELHLDEPKVRALESNDFEALGAPVFAKGHLRKYAELVGVDADDVFADYYQLTRAVGLPPVVAASRTKARQELTPGPWIAAIIVILAAVAAYWWLSSGDAVTTEEPNVEVQEPEPDPVTISEAVNTAADPVATADEEVLLPVEPEVTDAPVQQAPPDGQMRLSLVFGGDCWTEISDADGRRLFFNMGRSGQSVEMTGRPPLRALFGNADNVDVRVNGSAYTIPASARENRTARLSIQNP